MKWEEKKIMLTWHRLTLITIQYISIVLVPSTEYGPISEDQNNNKQEAGLPKKVSTSSNVNSLDVPGSGTVTSPASSSNSSSESYGKCALDR